MLSTRIARFGFRITWDSKRCDLGRGFSVSGVECWDWILLGFCIDDLQGFIIANLRLRGGFEQYESFQCIDEFLEVVDLVKLDAHIKKLALG